MKRPHLAREFIASLFVSSTWVFLSSFGLLYSVFYAFVFLVFSAFFLHSALADLGWDQKLFRYWWTVCSLWVFYFVFEVLTVPLGTIKWAENFVFTLPFSLACLASEKIDGEELKRGQGLISEKSNGKDAFWRCLRLTSASFALIIGLDLGLTSSCYAKPLFEESLLVLVPRDCLNAYADFRSSATTGACVCATASYLLLASIDLGILWKKVRW